LSFGDGPGGGPAIPNRDEPPPTPATMPTRTVGPAGCSGAPPPPLSPDRPIHPCRPIARAIERPRGQCRPVPIPIPTSPPQAPPPPILRPIHQVGPESIPLHIAAHRQQMVVRLHGERFEPALREVAGSGRVAVGVPALGVRHGEPAHERGEVAIGARPEQEMKVVGHHAIGQQPHVLTRDGLGEDSLECGVITVGLEEGQAGVAAVEGVVDEAALRRSSWSWHPSHGKESPARCQERFLTLFCLRGREGESTRNAAYSRHPLKPFAGLVPPNSWGPIRAKTNHGREHSDPPSGDG
jgi:hypothetical protein